MVATAMHGCNAKHATRHRSPYLKPCSTQSSSKNVIDVITRRQFGRVAQASAATTLVATCPIFRSHHALANVPEDFRSVRQELYNIGRPSEVFLEILVAWGRDMPRALFVRNSEYDIYSHVKSRLGPWRGNLHRRAVMLEVLRVLAGFESRWNWSYGQGCSCSVGVTDCAQKAGIFQCSAESMTADQSLRNLLRATTGSDDCRSFQTASKRNRTFALNYCAQLLRFTVDHHESIRGSDTQSQRSNSDKIIEFLSKDSVDEFIELIKN